MDQHTTKLQSKMAKMETSLMNLTSEILTAIKFLFQLRENSTEIVKNLNSITVPEMYLKEFMNVNYFISKYLNFLTEVNCKFEMLEMSGNSFNTSKPVIKCKSKTGFENISKANLSLNDQSTLNLKFINDCDNLKKFHVEEPLNAGSNMSKNDKLSDNNNNNNHNHHNNNDENLHFINKKLKNYSDTCSGQVVYLSEKTFSSDTVDQKKMILQPNNNSKSHCLKENLEELESSSFTCSISPSFEENPMHKSFNKASSSVSIKSDTNSSSYCNIQSNEIQSIARDNLATEPENVTTKLNNLDFKDLNLDNKNYAATQKAKLKEDTTKNGDIEPVNFERKLGEEYEVVIENIKSPSEFYVIIVNNQLNLMVELENKLKSIPKKENKINKRLEDRKASLNKEFGKYVLFYSKCDETWYRAEIINWYLNFRDDFVTVFLLDHGESKCVSLDDLEPMPECFKVYPAFAQRCHLHGIFPLDMDQNSDTLFWEKISTEKMRSLTEKSEKIKIRIAEDDCFHSTKSLPVTLWLVDKGNQCVNQLLVKGKYATQQPASDQKLQNTKDQMNNVRQDENLTNWNPMKEDFESYKNNYELDIRDPSAIIYGYVGKDYDRICPHFAKTGYCFKGRFCRKEHQKMDPLGFTTDKEEIFNNAFSVLPVPLPKTVINVQITCLLTFNQFCCIPMDSFYSGEENLQSLLKFMNKAENLREMKKLLIPPSPGQIVIARYSEDCSWYRARILESQPEKDLYKVLFVDYGNKETLSLSSLRAIEARYLHLPFQGMQCFIFGVDKNPKIPLQDVINYLNERINFCENITIEVVSKLPGEGTNLLVHVFDDYGTNIGDELIAKEYAIHKPEMLISNNSESIPG